jgi:hypothetical protein
MKKILALVVFVLFAEGCSSPGCIKIGGSYGGVDGSVEYCFSQEKSSDAGIPAFEEKKPSGDKETLWGIGESLIDKIIGKIGGGGDASALGSKSKIKELMRLLEE